MSRGLLSRLIYALLGEKEAEKKKEIAKQQPELPPKHAPGDKSPAEQAPGHKYRPPIEQGAKEWVPDLTRQPVQRKDKDKDKNKDITHFKKHEGAPDMIEQIGNKISGFVFRQFKKQQLINYIPVLAVLILLLIFTPLASYTKAIIIIIIFIFLGAASKLTQIIIPFVAGFDLCLFLTVIAGVAYHPLAGIVVGVVSSTLGSIIRGQHDMLNIIMPDVGYITVSLLLPFFSGISILYTGLIATAIYAMMMSAIFWSIKPHHIHTITFVVTTLGFNYWLFSNYATPLMNMIL